MIERIIIKNFKGIKEADISFHDNINVIVGNNGVGKSTLIEAISLTLGHGIGQLEITQREFGIRKSQANSFFINNVNI